MNPGEIDKLVKINVEKLKRLEGFEKVRFIILYGSAAEGTTREESDIDLCIDVQIFSQLPVYVKKEVLKGKVIFCRDEE